MRRTSVSQEKNQSTIIFFNFFKNRWTIATTDRWEGDLSCIPQVIFDSINLELCKPISEEEIEGVVKAMPREKASGPDGIPAKFYINC